MAFVAGAYQATYNGAALGKIEDGFTMRYRRFSETIVTDATGDAKQDGVYRGLQLTVSFIISEWNATGAQAAFWPFAATIGHIGTIGQLDTSLAKPLILNACGTTLPATITFTKALLSADFDVEHLFANRHRKVPIQMDVYPIPVGAAGSTGQCDPLKLFTTA